MPIFQKSVVKKYLKGLNKEQLESAYIKFKENYSQHKIEQIKSLKEEEYQDGFLREIFVDVFGYTLRPEPDYNLQREYKNQTDGKKADAAILKDDNAVAVIELKSTKTKDLTLITQQAFGYKFNQAACKYVITSNFQKLRFYVDNATEYEEFDLFHLDRDSFEFLYLVLNKDSIFTDLPYKIKEETRFHEQNISTQLYKDYSSFKRKLFENLCNNHPDIDKLTLFKKTQKLIDRFLFILFAEDRGLLPPNSIPRMIQRFEILKDEDAYKPIYDIFKQYFGYLNIGRKGKKAEDDIPAYNGGLFKDDDILNILNIDDNILISHLMKLSEYDFNTEVDVNILGHIFEHSLSEIEEISAEIQGITTDSSKSKRKKDGVFYTPKYITQYIVDNTIGKLCNEKRQELDLLEIEFDGTYRNANRTLTARGKALYEKLTTYKEWLLSLKIVDPACGSGAFLNQALSFLMAEHQNIDDIIAELTDTPIRLFDVDKDILEHNLFGVDINEESVEIAQLSLWLRTARKDRKLSTLSNTIKCGNSLIDDPTLAGDKAFNWYKEFPQVFREKEKKIWHITTVVHDTRTSQRMIEYKVRVPKANGQMHVNRSMCFEEDDALKITEIIGDIIIEDDFNILAFNVSYDHIHFILVCDEEELANIVRKIKGKSAQKFKEYKGIPKDETFNLWAQKFNKKEIEDEQQLETTINYIKNNREKHDLPNIHKGLQPLVDRMLCSLKHALRTEYKGGFDVVMGNPPYVVLSPLFLKAFRFTKGNNNTYIAFIELGLNIISKNGELGYIVPNTWFGGDNFNEFREYLIKDVNLRQIIQLPYDIFKAYIDTSIVLINKIKSSVYTDYYKYDIRDYQNNIDFKNLVSFPKNSWLKYGKVFLNNKLLKIGEKVWFSPKNILLGSISKINRGCLPPSEEEKSKIKNDFYNIKWFDNQVFRYTEEINDEVFVRYELLRENKNYEVYKGKRIFGRQLMSRQFRMNLTIINYNCAFKKNIYVIYSIDEKFTYEYILTILNSKLFSFTQVNFNTSLQRDDFPAFSLMDYKNFAIPKVNESLQLPFIEKANLMLTLNKSLHELSQKFRRTFERKFNIDSLPKKLEEWFMLTYKDFISELGKKRIKLGLSEEAEWEDYFLQEKQKALALKLQIETTDKEIDRMVYALYELTDEEIAIVEGNV